MFKRGGTRSIFGTFLRNSRGNVGLMTSMLAVPTLLTMGGAVDMVQVQQMRASLQEALDSAALAAASLTNESEIADIVDEYLRVNIPPGQFRDSIEVTIPSEVRTVNKRYVEIVASATYRPAFLKLANIDTIDIEATAMAVQAATNVEISMVLDVSTSMAGAKLTNMKSAAVGFVEKMLADEDQRDKTSINLVPFGGTVNIGQTLFDTYVESGLPTSDHWDVGEDDYYDSGNADNVLNGKWRFSWGGNCIEVKDEDFDGDALIPNSRPQVPPFWKWNENNPWCPRDSSSVLLNTNKITDLRNKINGFTLSDGTGMDIGALWGLKFLSPDWAGKLGGDFDERPAAYDEETVKVAIIMTDGEITQQLRPKDPSFLSVHYWPVNILGTILSRPSNQKNKNEQRIWPSGSFNNSKTQDKAMPHFKRVCDELKDDGAIIYTIGFQIKEGKNADKLLEYCASNPANYYFVEGLDIDSAFDSIASSVNALRIVG